MTDSELHRLKRSELLEMMVEQSKEIERLKRQLSIAVRRLRDRELMLEEAGSIAEASLQLSHIFAHAQKAADLYLENVERICRKRAAKEGAEEQWDDFLNNEWDDILNGFDGWMADGEVMGDSDE